MSAELLIISRLLTLTSTAMTIYEQITKIDALLKCVHAEGRTISSEEWAALDADLAAAKAAAEAARPVG